MLRLSTVPQDVAMIAEAVFVLFDVISFVFLIVVYYLVFVGSAISVRRWRRTKRVVLALSANPIVAIALIAPAHVFVIRDDLLAALISLGVGSCAYVFFYFTYFRPLIRSADFRIQNTMIFWGVIVALTISALLFLFLGRNFITIEKNATVSYELLIHSASIVISAIGIAFTYVMRSEQVNRNSKQQLYQTLELQSIELFRFECEHPQLVTGLWFQDKTGERTKQDEYCVRQYVCQMLNLFEMAIRFRTVRILPEDVFGSWVIWIWELCKSEKFQSLWLDEDDLPSNYIREFREVISRGVEIATRPEATEDARRSAFFTSVAERLNCWEIEQWFLGRTDLELAKIVRKRKSSLASA